MNTIPKLQYSTVNMTKYECRIPLQKFQSPPKPRKYPSKEIQNLNRGLSGGISGGSRLVRSAFDDRKDQLPVEDARHWDASRFCDA